MRLISRLLHWTTVPAGRRLMAVLGAALVIVLACNPDLLPLLPVVDALGLDVLMLLLGAQVVAVLPRVAARVHGACGDHLAAVALELHARVVLQAVQELHVGRLGEPVVVSARARDRVRGLRQVEAQVPHQLGQRVAALGKVAGVHVEHQPPRRQAHADVRPVSGRPLDYGAGVVVLRLPGAVARGLPALPAPRVGGVVPVQRDQRQARADVRSDVVLERWLIGGATGGIIDPVSFGKLHLLVSCNLAPALHAGVFFCGHRSALRVGGAGGEHRRRGAPDAVAHRLALCVVAQVAQLVADQLRPDAGERRATALAAIPR